MADRQTQIVNFYESTISGSILASAALSFNVSSAPTTNGTTVINATIGTPDTWFYLVIDPDNSGAREVVVVKASASTSFTTVLRDVESRYGGTPPNHQVGTTVRMAVLAEHFADMNDRLDAGLASLATAITATDIQDDDAFGSAAADKVASSESIKAYVDAQNAAQQVGASIGIVIALS